MAFCGRDFRCKFFTVAVMALSLSSAGFGQQASNDLGVVSKANTLFAKDLYSVLRKTYPGNLICSPLSISAVVAMVRAGAEGDTATEIERGLHFPVGDADSVYSGFKYLFQTLRSNQNFTLEIANKVYTNVGFELNENFKSILSESFGAQPEQINFAQSGLAANKINSWVEGVTHNKIKDLIGEGDLDSRTRLVLVNGIYFKGKWKLQFDSRRTVPATFYASQSEEVEVDMMSIEAEFPYAEIKELEAKAVALPYQGDRLSMIILLPNSRNGLLDMESKLKNFDVSRLSSLLRVRKVNLQMPRFKIESTIDLKGPLSKLGMQSMFSMDADFTGIPKDALTEPLYVSKAVQKAFIEVNEEGSEAAAATGVAIMVKSAIVQNTKQFIAEHPFVTLIYDEENDLQLFASTVENPRLVQTEFRSAVEEEVTEKPGHSGTSRQGTSGTVLILGLLYCLQRAL